MPTSPHSQDRQWEKDFCAKFQGAGNRPDALIRFIRDVISRELGKCVQSIVPLRASDAYWPPEEEHEGEYIEDRAWNACRSQMFERFEDYKHQQGM